VEKQAQQAAEESETAAIIYDNQFRVQTMIRNNPQKDHASSTTVTAMELNTRTH
jgi:hypothetical protein